MLVFIACAFVASVVLAYGARAFVVLTFVRVFIVLVFVCHAGLHLLFIHCAGIRLMCWCSSVVLVFVVRAFIMLAFVLLGSVYAGIHLSFAVHLLCWHLSHGHSPCWHLSVGLAFTCRVGIRLLRRLPSCVRPPVVLVFIHCAAECHASVCVHADVDAAVCGGVVITRVDSY